MCKDCGCSVVEEIGIHTDTHSHNHDYDHNHPHDHNHHHESHGNGNRTVAIAQSILDKNDRLAERNRGYFMAKEMLVLNVLSSPGSGKTAFIERTLTDLRNQIPSAVIVGDLETDNDAQRLRRSGVQVVQITTGTVCHLEADMVARAMAEINMDGVKLLVIENVGNLVCPAAYDLGENLRVALLSVTEGEDKPLKYPTLYKIADVVIINKIDIAEAVEFNRELALANIKRVVPQATIFEVSARTGAGMEQWYDFLAGEMQKTRSPILSQKTL